MASLNEEYKDILRRLESELATSRRAKNSLKEYSDGTVSIKGLNTVVWDSLEDKAKAQYQQFVTMAHLNMCPLIVDSVVNDMSLVAFLDTTNGGSASSALNVVVPGLNDEDGKGPDGASDVEIDKVEVAVAVATAADEAKVDADPDKEERDRNSAEAGRRIRDQHLASVFKRVITETLHHGDGYAWAQEDGHIVALSTFDTYVESDPFDPYNRVAAYTVAGDGTKTDKVTVAYIKATDGVVYKYTKVQRRASRRRTGWWKPPSSRPFPLSR